MKGSKLLRFTSAVTSVVAEPRGKWLLAGPDTQGIRDYKSVKAVLDAFGRDVKRIFDQFSMDFR